MAGTPSRTLVLTLTAVTDKFKKGIGDAEGSVKGFGEKLGDFSKKAGVALAALGVAAGALAIKIGKDAISAASDLSEELSKATVLFGESAGAIDDWAKTAATAFGQSRKGALQAAGNFAIFGKSAGLADQELVDFSTGFTELASDLASFNNTSPEDAVQALGAALRGESEPIRRYGILLDDATLRQKALELGIVTTTKEALTPQQRVLAAQAAILAQVGDAAGDFARTSDGLANSQRILQANLEDVKATLGEALLPAAQEFSAFLVRVMPDVIEFAREMGEKLAPAIDRAGTFIRDTLLPAAAEVWPHIRDFATWVGELVVGFTAFLREEIFPRALELIRDLKQPAADAWAEIKEMNRAIDGLTGAFRSANPEGSKFLDWLFGLSEVPFRYILEQIETLARFINAVATGFERLVRLGAISGPFGAGGDFTVPDAETFATPGFPNSTLRAAQTITNNYVTIEGAIDSEAAAREVYNLLNDSQLRTGFQPATAF